MVTIQSRRNYDITMMSKTRWRLTAFAGSLIEAFVVSAVSGDEGSTATQIVGGAAVAGGVSAVLLAITGVATHYENNENGAMTKTKVN